MMIMRQKKIVNYRPATLPQVKIQERPYLPKIRYSTGKHAPFVVVAGGANRIGDLVTEVWYYLIKKKTFITGKEGPVAFIMS